MKTEHGGNDTVIAFFDIDDTLTKFFSIISFAEFLEHRDHFDSTSWQHMEADLDVYRKSKREDPDYYKFAVNLVENYAKGISGQIVAVINKLAPSFLDKALQGQVGKYEYTIKTMALELVTIFKPVATTIAISGSPMESLLPLIKYLSFDALQSTIITIQDGRFTNHVEINMAIDQNKRAVVLKYLDTNFDATRSFAFGDSMHDIPLLEVVGNAFVVGDNKQLQKVAVERGWFTGSDDDILSEVKSRLNRLFLEY